MSKSRVLAFFVMLVVMLSVFPVGAYASSDHMPAGEKTIDIRLNDDVGFVLQQGEKATAIDNIRGKQYTSDSYNGYFYIISTGQVISHHTFTAKFSYDGSLATCYQTKKSIVMDSEYTGNLRPKAENEGRNNLTPTLVYGYISFVLYNSNNTVNSEVTINIYCNQNGSTWVERQG